MTLQQGSFTRNFDQSDKSGVFPRFFVDTIQDIAASEREGRPIYKEVERVQIVIPGNPHFSPVENVTLEHKERWPKAYEAFKKGLDPVTEGYPLKEWAKLTRSQVLELNALGIFSVEQLAAVSDHALQRIGLGARVLREAAKAFLDEQYELAEFVKVSAENERLQGQLAELQKSHAETRQLLETVSAQLLALQSQPNAVQTFTPPAPMPQTEAPAQSALASVTAKRARPGKAA